MSLKITEKELSKLVDSGKVKISLSSEKNKPNKISLSDNSNEIKKNKSSSSVNINKVMESTKLAEIKYSISETHLSLVFIGATLLSVNQIFAFLQREKQQYLFFMYKKIWHNKIYEALMKIKSEEKHLPFFDKDIELTLFRQAPREIDMDAITTMFKFIIDGLKKTKENPIGILAEDNPKVVHSIKFHNEKGDNVVGIKLKLVKNEKETITYEDILY